MDNFDFPKDAVFLGHPVIEAVFWSATKLQSLHATGVCTQIIKMSRHGQKVRHRVSSKNK